MITPIERNLVKSKVSMSYYRMLYDFYTRQQNMLWVGLQLDMYHALFSHIFLVLYSLTFPTFSG
jgi:hypothetical protein